MNIKSIVLILVLGANFVLAQTKTIITLKDSELLTPIENASYKYGQQNGVTNENGEIIFFENNKDTMMISHVSYGSWSWKPLELKTIIQNKTFYQANRILNLFPVTIIALKPFIQSNDQLKLNHQDYLSHDAVAILNQTPAISSIRKSGNYGFDPVFRGFKYDQINIVLDGGQSATAACPNRMDPPTSQMAPNMLDRIDILKGPYALRFGTGFGATINFISKPLLFSDSLKIKSRVSAGYESNGNIRKGEGNIGLSGQKFNLTLFGAWAEGDDYQAGNKETIQADFLRNSFGSTLGLKLSKNQELKLSTTYNMARNTDFAALTMDLITDDTWLFNVQHSIKLNKKHIQSINTSLFGSFVNHVMSNELKELNPRQLNAITNATTHNFGARSEGTWILSKGKFYAGLDYKSEGAAGIREREFLIGPNTGKTFYDNAWQDGEINKLGAFGEYHIFGDKINYIISGRLEDNFTKVNSPDENFTQINQKTSINQLNPSFSFGAKKSLKNNLSSSLWIGRAQRSGSLIERFINFFPVGQDPYEMLGNPDIRPEINNQIDLTFDWKAEKSTINLDIYTSYLQDFISSVIDTSIAPRLSKSPGVRQYTNINQAIKYGAELNWNQQLFWNLQQQFGIAYTFAQNLVTNQPLPEIPPLDIKYSLRGHYYKNKITPSVIFHYAMNQNRISEEFGESATPSFFVIDINLNYNILNNLRINGGINNLLNTTYNEHLSRSVSGSNTPIYNTGRSLFANLSYSF